MKIVCDACQAKYSISDDKVQGKVFKIRCKKCSNIIVVRGGAEANPAPAPQQEKDTRVYDYGYEGGEQAHAGDESVWHVVINQDQVGPMTAADVRARFAAGEIDGETYGWREGFADWLPLGQIDAFAELVASGSTTAAVGKGAGQDAVSAMFGGGGATDESGTMRSDPGDLFAAASGGGRAQAAASSSHDDDGDLFGSKPAAAKAGGGDAKLRGERNENSVLFSLNNLAQLASDKPAPVMSAPSGGHATGAAGGEGSGLIDIRSMASAYLGGGAAMAKSGTGASSSIGSIDDLPVFGGGGFSEPAVIVPTSRSQGNNKFMLALIGGVGVLAVAAIILVVVMMKGNNKNNDQVSQNDKPTGAVGSDKEPGGNTPDQKPVTPPPSGSDTAKPATGSDTAAKPPETPTTPPTTPTTPTTPDKKPVTPPVNHNKPPTPTVGGQTPPVHKDPTPVAHKDPTPPPTTPDKKPPAGDAGGCDEVSCVLNNYEGACCSKFKKGGGTAAKKPPPGGGDPTPPAKPASDLPDALDRSMISSGVDKVKARVMACGDKSPAKGQVKVSVKVGGDGHVVSVTVKATPDPGLGSCVQAAMGKATFAKTQNGGSFGYPFVF